jgi:hypothetical protein
MNLLSSLASIVIFIAAVLTFYTALLHLTRKHTGRSYIFRIVRDALVGLQTFQLYFVTRDLHLQHPFLLYLFVTLLFLSGALNYIRYFMFFYPGGKIPARVKWQFVPAALVFLGETRFYFVNYTESHAVIRDVFANPTHDVVADPQESYNLKDDHPDAIAEMKQKFRTWEAQMEAKRAGWN